MKRIKLFVFTAGILLLGFTFLQSCESDNAKDYPVKISFSNSTALDSVFDGDAYVLSGRIIADGPIEKVQFYRNFLITYTQNSVQVTKQDSTEMAASEISNIKGDTCDFSVNVPNVIEKTTVRVVATQKDGHQTSAVYTINSGRIPNITRYTNLWAGGWDAPVFGNFYSLELTNPISKWGISTESNNPTVIPLCQFYFGDYKVGATDLDSLRHSSQTPGFSDIGTRFAKTDFTPAQFDAMRLDNDFKTLKPTLTWVPFDVDEVIVFKTKTGKLGLIKIISMDSNENYNFNVIIQK